MEFESAAAIHTRLDKLNPVLQQLPEFVHRIDRSHAIVVQKSQQPECVTLFRADLGALAGPLEFPISGGEHTKSQSMEARIQAALTEFPAYHPESAVERMEHLAILKRWCYRGSRTGEIFFADAVESCRCDGSFEASAESTKAKLRKAKSLRNPRDNRCIFSCKRKS